MKHTSGPWWKFIIPRRITISPVRIYRWLNFYWRLKDEPSKEEEAREAENNYKALVWAAKIMGFRK